MKNAAYNNKTKRQYTTVIAVFCYLVQALIPLGFMPASWADEGSYITLCPSTFGESLITTQIVKHSEHGQLLSTTSKPTKHSHHHQGQHPSQAAFQTQSPAANDIHTTHASHHQHESSNHSLASLCDYGSSSSAMDALLRVDHGTAELSHTHFTQQRLRFIDVASQRHRKQRSRAPPFA